MLLPGNIAILDDCLRVDWPRRMAAKYERLSCYPWLAAEPEPSPPLPLAHPRSARELPGLDYSNVTSVYDLHPPAWTLLWTWRRE
jgi:hypothetical protein